MTHEMLEQAGERREPASDGRGLGVVGLTHDALPGDDGAVVHLTQLVIGLDVQRPHEMLHVEFVCASGAFVFLLGEPDFFFGDVGERRDGGNRPVVRSRQGKGDVRVSRHCG